jgi:predicted small secreted protein
MRYVFEAFTEATEQESDMIRPARRNLPSLLAAAMAGAFFAALLGGCNTISGIGEDVEAAGAAIEDEAQEEKRY